MQQSFVSLLTNKALSTKASWLRTK